jgi:uncharacterized protein YaaW (UPF0174 family)
MNRNTTRNDSDVYGARKVVRQLNKREMGEKSNYTDNMIRLKKKELQRLKKNLPSKKGYHLESVFSKGQDSEQQKVPTNFN